jgi:hypothetical protein
MLARPSFRKKSLTTAIVSRAGYTVQFASVTSIGVAGRMRRSDWCEQPNWPRIDRQGAEP